ncbi:MAG: PilZ domain-containing protein [Betaproteobacteria bacterium]|nr:PilZ domain-containing protein [Betaproteobacteria bacterium]
MDNNRRHFSRVSFNSPARLSFTSAQGNKTGCAATVLDLSLKGALLRLDEAAPLPIGAVCVLEIPLDDAAADEAQFIRMEMTVAHIETPHWGFVCRSLDLDSATHLRRLVTLNLGDAALLERELPALLQGL